MDDCLGEEYCGCKSEKTSDSDEKAQLTQLPLKTYRVYLNTDGSNWEKVVATDFSTDMDNVLTFWDSEGVVAVFSKWAFFARY